MNEQKIVELSEFIALRHEAKPTPEECRDRDKKYEWWQLQNRWTGQTWEYRVVPVNCLHPEIAMRLLRELLVDWIVSIDWSSQLKNYEVTLDSKSSNESHVGVGGSLELAIAQAWKKAVESDKKG